MTELIDRLMRADRHGRPVAEVVRHHLLEGVLRRIARLEDCGGFVLRGGMLTRQWSGLRYRRARDLDFVGAFRFDVPDTARRFAPVLTTDVDDGVVFDPGSLVARGIWLDTAFPGVRLSLRLGLQEPDVDLTIDVGFNDPLVPPAELVEYRCLLGDVASVWCAAPEAMAGWKLHGLAEKGSRRWRPKDLADLYLLALSPAVRDDLLPAAVEAAFVSRGCTLDDGRRLFGPQAWWGSKNAIVAWVEFRKAAPEMELPRDLRTVVDVVRERFGPALG